MSDAQKPVRNFTAAKAFIVYGGRILYLREAGSYIDGSQVGRYDISGGRLNPGEDVMDGLKREVMEETGLTLAEVFPFKEIDWRVDKGAEVWHIHAHFFVAVPSEPHVRYRSIMMIFNGSRLMRRCAHYPSWKILCR